jgi:kumamolisin
MLTLKGLTTASLLAVAALPQISSARADSVDLVIGLQERVSLATLAENATRFGVTYTPEQIRAAAGPTDSDYAAALAGLRGEGFTIVKETATHLFVTVRGEKSTIENAFQTKFTTEATGVRHASFANVPSHLSFVKTIVGLDNSNKRVSHYKISKNQSTSTAPSAGPTSAWPSSGGGRNPTPPPPTPSSQPGVLPAAIKTAYGFDPIYSAGLTGKGQAIAVATYDGLLVSEIKAYFPQVGIKTTRTIDVVSFNGTAAYNAGSAMETELDAEFSGMIAPNADIHIFASAENSDAGELAMFTAILDDNRAKVVNYSWGSCETNLTPDHKTAMDTVFAQAVAQGVNIFVASGDSGSDGCGDGTLAADYPASHPHVIAVGGTTLVNSGSDFEDAWSGSGGGISKLYDLPKYQAGLGAPYVKRSLPDVAFNADPQSGEAAWETVASGVAKGKKPSATNTGAEWVVLGGTSIAAPQWAGFMTLVGEAKAKTGKTVGFVNPQLYALNATQRDACLSDVKSGSNGQYSAGAGWDAVTGFGSMKANALFTQLTK